MDGTPNKPLSISSNLKKQKQEDIVLMLKCSQHWTDCDVVQGIVWCSCYNLKTGRLYKEQKNLAVYTTLYLVRGG